MAIDKLSSAFESRQRKLKQAVDCLKLTIPRMKDLEIPITPENYFVWYEYINGGNVELKKQIEAHLDAGTTFTDALNHELYETYFANQRQDQISDVQSGTERLVDNLLSELEGILDGAHGFSNTLEKSQSELKKNPDIKAISRLVANLIEETDEVKRVNSSMEQSLNLMKDEVCILKHSMDELNTTAYTDQLTSIPNRRAFDKSIKTLWEGYQSEGRYFSLLFMDIDHFKSFNDTHGHAVGDKVLAFIASLLKKGIKGDDMVARYGGEEFVVLLPDTLYEGALTVGQQLCDKVAKKNLVMGGEEKVTLGNIHISVGVSTVFQGDDVNSILKRADQALYTAKEQGRNRVVGERALITCNV